MARILTCESRDECERVGGEGAMVGQVGWQACAVEVGWMSGAAAGGQGRWMVGQGK